MSKPMEQLAKRFAQHRVELQQAIDRDLPRLLGNRLTGMVRQNFVDEGYFGQRWQEVKRRSHPRSRRSGGLRADARRRILTGATGNLGRSIADRPGRASVTIYSDVPYAAYHNEGTDKLPRRQFMGDHPRLRQEARRMIEDHLKKILRP